ncbi:MAG: TraB/GumN family protein [Spirochaetaceae bacterium]|jgi:pheromone shutdown-related protein TraB|nr:TraB/GumN family protein [Spirochaetaceae bacterium]
MTSDTVITLNLDGKKIILLGTAHISSRSAEEAGLIIRSENPGLVCVELDKKRYEALTQKDNWENLDIIKVIREGRGFLLLANLVLAGFQRRLGNETGARPGEEMKAAIEAADELNIPYKLCDRDLQITLRRAWESCGFWSKCKLLASLFSSAFTNEKFDSGEIENLKQQSELDGMMAELSGYLPSVKKTLIDERDEYLAAKIWEGVREKEVNCAVAVVGAGHIAGLAARLEECSKQSAPVSVDELEKIPPKSWIGRALPWAVPVLILGLIALGFAHAGINAGLDSIVRWLLWNGSLAAAGAALALGHPFAIIAAFVGAPIGTLSPIISVGFFAGIAQALARRPRVADAVSLSADAASLKGVYKNRITRALLVFFLSGIGGAIGNFISIPVLTRVLF